MPALELPRPRSTIGWLRLAVFLAVMAVVVKCAWVSDDSFITMRSVDNFLHGRGMTWNPGERVQVFTHPLWFFVLAAAKILSPSPYWAVVLAGIVVSGLAFALLLRRSPPVGSAIVAAGVVLMLSRATMDFATSGLENPLAFLLLVLALRHDLAAPDVPGERGRHLLWLALAGSLLALTRLDLALLVAPVLVERLWRGGWRQPRALLLAAAPFLAWEIFALAYFGFPLPNTAYAKLGAGIAGAELMQRGWWYFEAILRRDTLTIVALLAGLLLVAVRGDRRRRLWGAGVLLYLVYVVRIGGDFMIGRFLAAPLVATIVLAGDLLPAGRKGWAVVAVLLLGVLNPRNPVTSPVIPKYEYWFHGVADERGYYYPNTGVVPRFRAGFEEQEYVVKGRQARQIMQQQGEAFQEAECIGFYGYYAGPRLHVIDVMALADPFLARLPMRRRANPQDWRIGHFERDLPAGYRESVASGTNVISDPELARLYDDVRLATKGPLFSGERWRAILRLNLRGGPAN